MKFIHYFILGITLLSLSGCGYRLAGKADLDPVFDQTHVAYVGNGKRVADLLEVRLRANEVNLVGREDATAVISILYDYSEKNIQSLDNDGNVREYELVLEVRFDVADSEGKKLLAPQELRLSRDLLFDVNDVLGVQEEERQLYDEMREDAARLVLYRIQAISG